MDNISISNQGYLQLDIVMELLGGLKQKGKKNIYPCYCQICGLNFTQRYGEVGKDFIHVHHKVPLNQISEEYEVDPVNDLIPVCPNCHAMLHRKVNEKHLSIDELKAILKR